MVESMRQVLTLSLALLRGFCYCQTWQDANFSKEIAGMKEAISTIESTRTLAGIQDKERAIQLIINEKKKLVADGSNPIALARLIAAMNVARTSPGIDGDLVFQRTQTFIRIAVTNMGKVDSYHYARTVLIYSLFQPLDNPKVPPSIWNAVYVQSKDDPFFLEHYAFHVGYKMKNYDDTHLRSIAQTLASSVAKGSATRAYFISFIYYQLGMKNNSKKDLESSLKYLTLYYEALNRVGSKDAEQIAVAIDALKKRLSKMQ